MVTPGRATAVITSSRARACSAARRAAHQGFAFPEPGAEYAAFAASFAFEETPDQQQAIDAIIADSENAVEVSPASYWEIAIKISLGKYALDEPLAGFFGLVKAQRDAGNPEAARELVDQAIAAYREVLPRQAGVDAAADIACRLTGAGARLVGLDADEELADQVSGIHAILGGHSHTTLTRPERVNLARVAADSASVAPSSTMAAIRLIRSGRFESSSSFRSPSATPSSSWTTTPPTPRSPSPFAGR